MTAYDTPEKMEERRAELAASMIDESHWTKRKSLRLTALVGTTAADFDRVDGFDDGEGPRGSY